MRDVSSVEDVFELAETHAESVNRDREDYLDTFDEEVTIDNVQVHFHIDNSPAIYITLPNGMDDLVYVDTEEARNSDGMTGPFVTAEEFKERVEQLIEEYKEMGY